MARKYHRDDEGSGEALKEANSSCGDAALRALWKPLANVDDPDLDQRWGRRDTRRQVLTRMIGGHG